MAVLKLGSAAKHLRAALRELEVGEDAVDVVESPPLPGLTDDAFDTPDDGKLRFRDLTIGEEFHFMGSWPGVDHAVPGYRKYTKVTARRFTLRDGDRVSSHHVRADLMEVARAEPAKAPAQ